MSLEKPISTIKKAVQRMAEESAEKESLDKPEQRHYDDVFTSYKILRMLEPKRLEVYIKTTAKSQELKNEIGAELFNVFDEVWIDATKEGKSEIKNEVDQLESTFKLLFPKEYNSELERIDKKYLKEKAEQVKNDPRVVQAFSGKEELLNKALDTTTSSMLDLMSYNRNAPKSKYY